MCENTAKSKKLYLTGGNVKEVKFDVYANLRLGIVPNLMEIRFSGYPFEARGNFSFRIGEEGERLAEFTRILYRLPD